MPRRITAAIGLMSASLAAVPTAVTWSKSLAGAGVSSDKIHSHRRGLSTDG